MTPVVLIVFPLQPGRPGCARLIDNVSCEFVSRGTNEHSRLRCSSTPRDADINLAILLRLFRRGRREAEPSCQRHAPGHARLATCPEP